MILRRDLHPTGHLCLLLSAHSTLLELAAQRKRPSQSYRDRPPSGLIGADRIHFGFWIHFLEFILHALWIHFARVRRSAEFEFNSNSILPCTSQSLQVTFEFNSFDFILQKCTNILPVQLNIGRDLGKTPNAQGDVGNA